MKKAIEVFLLTVASSLGAWAADSVDVSATVSGVACRVVANGAAIGGLLSLSAAPSDAANATVTV